ncbi:hypothetical protein ZOSMA_4G01420 [Zostera marina]|uniref:Uncharacterized protein n=1 Tax=Zostera marina TaxID=29655 RepID=A0A0K9NYR0_ZOSMR|nr:hypothetical protein ZOSMA_4G01420 [Zostera marina]
MTRKKSKTKVVASKEAVSASPPPPPPSLSSPPPSRESLEDKEAMTKLETLQSLNSILVRETSTMREKMKNIQSQMMEMEELCGDHEPFDLVDELDISSLFNKMRSLMEKRAMALEQRIKAEEELVESLRRSKEELVGEVDGLRDEIRNLNKEDLEKSIRVSNLEKMNVDLEGEVGYLKGELEVQNSEIAEVQCLSNTLNGKINSLNKKNQKKKIPKMVNI